MTDKAWERSIDLSKVVRCRIHPGIGIARVGNSPDAFFIGPEMPVDPQRVQAPDGAYKDKQGRVKRQAARYRIYGYDSEGNNLGELPLAGPDDAPDAKKARVEWHVRLANRKGAWHRFAAGGGNPEETNVSLRNAYSVTERYPDTRESPARSELIVDPGQRSIWGDGRSESRIFDSGRFLGTPVPLGELRTDAAGRLLVLGGFGHAASTRPDNPIGGGQDETDFWVDNDNWYDDVSDGPVTATVTLPVADGRTIEVTDAQDAAWVIVAPPDFAPGIRAIVTLYDVIREVALEAGWLDGTVDGDDDRDVLAVLRSTADIAWVDNDARRGHKLPLTNALGEEERARIFAHLRNPLADAATAQRQATSRFMPPLAGDGGPARNGKPGTWLTLLPSQYRKFGRWRADGFKGAGRDESRIERRAASLDALTPDDQVLALQRAALEPAVGGAFYPGVEVSAVIKARASYASAFRIDAARVSPGDLTKALPVPWHAGLYLRKGQWWPSARPEDVVSEEVFDEVDRQWAVGGKPVRDGLEGRVKWDRGLGVSTLLRRPWKNPATAEDDPRDATRRGADDMVRYWSELGFVVPRRTKSGEIVHIETERRPHAGMDIRELFHALLNLEHHRSSLDKAREYVEAVLAAAREVQRLPSAFNFMNNIRPFKYTEAVFDARMKDIYDDCAEFGLTEGGRPYNPANENHNPYFQTRESVVERLRQLAPFNFLDGAWLRNVHRLGPMDEVNSILFSIFNEELGDGVLAQNHANIYRDLCHSAGLYLPPVASTAFARDPQFLDASFESAVFQLGIAEYPDRYYPELIGMTLWLEWTALELHRVASIVEHVGFNPHFYRLHLAIDNAEDGHAAQIFRGVKIYLHNVLLQGGDAAVQAQWQRIWDGYVAYALTFAILIQQVIRVVREPLPLQRRLENLIERKKTYGQYNHGTKKLGGVAVNQWFNDPKGFLRALVTEGLVIPGKPDESRFFKLLDFHGPMYHVFTEPEIKLWHDWAREEAATLLEEENADAAPVRNEARRLQDTLSGRVGLVRALGEPRLAWIRRAVAARRFVLWIDEADKQTAMAAGEGASDRAARRRDPGADGRVAAWIGARFEAWLGWSIIRSLTHLAAQPWLASRAANGDGERAAGALQVLVDGVAQVRQASTPAQAGGEVLARLKAVIVKDGALSDSEAWLAEASGTPFASALELVAPGNDGRRIRELLAVWVEAGSPLPNVPDGGFRPLRLEATLDEEEHHPTGVALGFGTVH